MRSTLSQQQVVGAWVLRRLSSQRLPLGVLRGKPIPVFEASFHFLAPQAINPSSDPRLISPCSPFPTAGVVSLF